MTSAKFSLLCSLLCVAALADDPAPAKPDKPSPGVVQGVWQVTVKLQQSGLPIPALPKVAKLCLSSAEAKDVTNLTPQKLMPRFHACQEIRRDEQDGKINIDYRCNEKPETLGKLEAIYGKDKIKGTFQLFAKPDNIHIVYEYDGEAIGLCPDASAPKPASAPPAGEAPKS